MYSISQCCFRRMETRLRCRWGKRLLESLLNRESLLSCFRYLFSVAMLLVLATPVLGWQEVAEPSLVVGSVAPDLNVASWLSKGNSDQFPEVTKFEKGKVYIVEFWATWCPPCVASMPHLSELQEKYAAKGVQVISITDEPLETVTAFLEGKVRGDPSKTYAELTKNYCLTTDPDGSSHISYTEASGVPGIPAAFLIGKSGKIEWIGHPVEIDEPLELVVADKFDAVAYQKLQAEREQRREKLAADVGGVLQLVQGGKNDEALVKLDKIIAGAHEDERTSLTFLQVEILGASGKPKLAVQKLDQILAKASGEEEIEMRMLKLQILASEKMPGAEKAFFEIAELANSVGLQNSSAWTVVQMHLEGTAVSPKMVAKARQLVDAAAEAHPVADVLETQAHLVFIQGDVDKAIEIQTKALEMAREPQLKQRLAKFLEEWQAKKMPKKMETESDEQLPSSRR